VLRVALLQKYIGKHMVETDDRFKGYLGPTEASASTKVSVCRMLALVVQAFPRNPAVLGQAFRAAGAMCKSGDAQANLNTENIKGTGGGAPLCRVVIELVVVVLIVSVCVDDV
jgi:hypothetical protein